MTRLLIVSDRPGDGKTGVAAAIARHYAYKGRSVTLARLPEGDSAAADAAFFASLDFAPGSPAEPVAANDLPGEGDGLLIIEGASDAGAFGAEGVVRVTTAKLPAPDGAAVVIVNRAEGAVPGETGGVPVIAIPEDRTLAGFSVARAREALNAEVLLAGENGDPTCDHLVVAPIGSDAGQPYFELFDAKAVVVRFDKTDQHLAALASAPECLILSGGRRPSDYLFDAAGSRGVPVLLSATDTENTVIALEGIFAAEPFRGERKLERMSALLEATPLFDGMGV